MARLKAPAAKVLPYLEGRLAYGHEMTARPITSLPDLAAITEEARPWFAVNFEAMRRAFDGYDHFTRQMNLYCGSPTFASPESYTGRLLSHRAWMANQLAVLEDAIAFVREASHNGG